MTRADKRGWGNPASLLRGPGINVLRDRISVHVARWLSILLDTISSFPYHHTDA